MGGILFKKVTTVAKLWKQDLKKADKMPRNYDHTPFTLDGRIEMDLTFDNKTMRTSVYIKTDTHDQLLLSEGSITLSLSRGEEEGRRSDLAHIPVRARTFW